jgi:hypothetical protein
MLVMRRDRKVAWIVFIVVVILVIQVGFVLAQQFFDVLFILGRCSGTKIRLRAAKPQHRDRQAYRIEMVGV